MIRLLAGFLATLFLSPTALLALGNADKDPFRPVASQTIIPSIVRSSKMVTDIQMDATARQARRLGPALRNVVQTGGRALGQHLARVTAYWAGEDHFSHERKSASGVRLHSGACAVDPKVIPYGSVVQIPGIGRFVAVDTGTAVVSRRAARECGHTRAECNALVVDLFFEKREDCEKFTSSSPEFASISWSAPVSARSMQLARMMDGNTLVAKEL